MEMTYTGAMVMPNTYVVIDNDEMQYLDGGGIPNWSVRVAVSAVFFAVGIGSGISAYRTLKGASGKYLAKRAVPKLAKKIGISIGSTFASAICSFLNDVFDPVGWVINKLDKMDGWSDGWIGGHGWGQWTGLSMRYF